MKKLFDGMGWLVLFLFLASCVSVKKAEDVLNKNPGEAARYCAEKYPVKDSAGEAGPVKPAQNVNYQGKIDSLFELAAQLANKIYQDSVANAQRVASNLPVDTNKLAKDVIFYRNKAKSLADQLFKLQANYRPCKPDTVYITRYRENTARVDACLFQKLELEKKLAVQKSKAEDWEDKAKNRGWIMWLLIGSIGIGIFLKIRGIL